MTKTVGRLNITVVSRGFGFHDVVVTNDKGVIIHTEEDVFARTKFHARQSEEYAEAVTFAERYSVLLDLADQALQDSDIDRLQMLASWMEDMREM